MPIPNLRWFFIRFVLPLAVTLLGLAYFVVPLAENLTVRWFTRDLDNRSQLIAGSLHDPLAEFIRQGEKTKIQAVFNRAIQDKRLYALAFCDPTGQPLYRTAAYPDSLRCDLPSGKDGQSTPLLQLPQGSLHVALSPVDVDGARLGTLVLIHDMSFIERRSADTKRYVIILFGIFAVVVSLVTAMAAYLGWRTWMRGMRALLRSDGSLTEPITPELLPLVGEVRSLLREIDEERRLRENSTLAWTPDTLRGLLHDRLYGDEILVVSNREPYIHVRTPAGIVVQRPVSGLVTAVEPVMRACSGTWIAHGSGNADRETSDRKGRVRVPPEAPAYSLRRIWLTPEEEQGYYNGFANEGLWPLCHIAHIRPVFRTGDWDYYVKVNRRFAEAVAEESRTDDPVVLVQDYHFALLPRLIRQRLPRATIITFWHIPWPNPESFGICAWRERILDGLLGSTILGFHTRVHCKNFIETVDRFLEARIEHESSTISYGGKLTLIRHYPISIHWPTEEAQTWPSIDDCRADIREQLGVAPDHLLGLGVDRLDYTKGIVERFQAVERLLEQHPKLIGRFTFVQIAAPSRSSLDEYQHLAVRVNDLVERINQRFARDDYQPIVLKVEHHAHDRVMAYFRAVDVCVVTSLHDGMNLVAKEFVAARDDERGVLLLSHFAGAARELREALIVNPYHIEQTAEALYVALTMPAPEQRERMRSLRVQVREANVYRWAGMMLQDAARLRDRERIAARIHYHSRAPLKHAV